MALGLATEGELQALARVQLDFERRLAALELAAEDVDTLAAAPVSPLLVTGEPAGLKLIKVAGDGWQLQNAAGEVVATLDPVGGVANALLAKRSATTGDLEWTINPLIPPTGSIVIQGALRLTTSGMAVPEGAAGVLNLETGATFYELTPEGPGVSKISGLTVEGFIAQGGKLLIIRNKSATIALEIENEVVAAGLNAFALTVKATLKLEPRHVAMFVYVGTAKHWIQITNP